MADITLTGSQQAALRQLLTLEAVPGEALPRPAVLNLLDRLVPCDSLGVTLADNRGYPLESLELPYDTSGERPMIGGDGPYLVGFVHWPEIPQLAEQCQALYGCTDGVCIGFRNGADHVAQIWFDRFTRTFTDQDLALLRLLVPVFHRLLRSRPTRHLPTTLTTQERNVLAEATFGSSNAEIAESLCIASGTVRKHLEHSYRKLGVTNRLAAVMAFTGRELSEASQVPEIDRVTGWNGRSTRERV
ncbi:MAG: helix-turn-helix transcriptional regulator [Ornithinibacter sp.]